MIEFLFGLGAVAVPWIWHFLNTDLPPREKK